MLRLGNTRVVGDLYTSRSGPRWKDRQVIQEEEEAGTGEQGWKGGRWRGCEGQRPGEMREDEGSNREETYEYTIRIHIYRREATSYQGSRVPGTTKSLSLQNHMRRALPFVRFALPSIPSTFFHLRVPCTRKTKNLLWGCHVQFPQLPIIRDKPLQGWISCNVPIISWRKLKPTKTQCGKIWDKYIYVNILLFVQKVVK